MELKKQKTSSMALKISKYTLKSPPLSESLDLKMHYMFFCFFLIFSIPIIDKISISIRCFFPYCLIGCWQMKKYRIFNGLFFGEH